MNDLENFKQLYKSVGIKLTEKKLSDTIYLHLESGEHKKLIGYTFFYSNIYFDLNGKFINQSFAE
jgi:hypothetical protein